MGTLDVKNSEYNNNKIWISLRTQNGREKSEARRVAMATPPLRARMFSRRVTVTGTHCLIAENVVAW